MRKNSTMILDYEHLITTRPHDIQQVVISDLHLSDDEPALTQAFSSLLDDLIALPNLQKLFIAGDWFDVWIGDDAYLSLSEAERQSHWLTPLIKQLKVLQQTGCRILVMHGNRDFLIGQAFCDTFKGQLINEPYNLKIGGQYFRLEHGDALCTDDTAYQCFRMVMRNPLVQRLLLSRPLDKRQQMASNLRKKSNQENSQKAEYVMDVNNRAVAKSARHYDALLHGHTHRPDIHPIDNSNNGLNVDKLGRAIGTTLGNRFKKVVDKSASLRGSRRHTTEQKFRYVLGDWRVMNKERANQRVEAMIGVVIGSNTSRQSRSSFRMVKFKVATP